MRKLVVILVVALSLAFVAPASAGNPNLDPCNPRGIHTEQYVC